MYELYWITDHLATGHAPMSYVELDSIREHGISAIVNLCGEFCDLHEIEDSSGFDVYYLPVDDEHAPDLEAMEQALDWMDEAIYLDKKVLVHCRMGHGRTGTFIAAYLLRRGFDFKSAERTMKGRKAVPATYDQRRFLKKYGKQVGPLQTAAPRIDNRPVTAVNTVIGAHHDLLARFDEVWPAGEGTCGRDDHPCCHRPFDLQLIESMHLSQVINRQLKQKKRQEVIDRAVMLAARLKDLHHLHPGLSAEEMAAATEGARLTCPLLEDGGCLVFADRPPRCRYWGHDADDERFATLQLAISELSRQAYRTLTGQEPPEAPLRFSSADTISGKFVQLYFQTMAGRAE
ncbi:MAG: dual specificity protein phosphatase family protein [Desulfobulbus sp.]|jgi:protein-tyrosine phosphatase|nr:dual specificity protein phosphatase family protein [Desulfobulbus sp.]